MSRKMNSSGNRTQRKKDSIINQYYDKYEKHQKEEEIEAAELSEYIFKINKLKKEVPKKEKVEETDDIEEEKEREEEKVEETDDIEEEKEREEEKVEETDDIEEEKEREEEKVEETDDIKEEKEREEEKVEEVDNIEEVRETEIKYEETKVLEKSGEGQAYKSQKITLNPPKQDIIVSIPNISRYIYVKEVEIFDNSASVTAIITTSVNYGTSKDTSKEKKEETHQQDQNEEKKKERVILVEEKYVKPTLADGVVRNSTSIIPCKIYVSIPGAKPGDIYSIVDSSLKIVDTKYLLDDGSVEDAVIPLGRHVIAIIETYVVSVSIKIGK